jgi:hypothetical protein
MNINIEYPKTINLSFTLHDYNQVAENSDRYFLDKYPIPEAFEKSNLFLTHYKKMIQSIEELKN